MSLQTLKILREKRKRRVGFVALAFVGHRCPCAGLMLERAKPHSECEAPWRPSARVYEASLKNEEKRLPTRKSDVRQHLLGRSQNSPGLPKTRNWCTQAHENFSSMNFIHSTKSLTSSDVFMRLKQSNIVDSMNA